MGIKYLICSILSICLFSLNSMARSNSDAYDDKENINYQDADGNTKLMETVRSRRSSDVYDLLDKGAKVNACNHEKETALMIACDCGEILIIRSLIKYGANVNAKTTSSETALIRAMNTIDDTIYGDNALEIVKLLVSKGADVNAKTTYGETALMRASHHGDNALEIVKLLVSKGADVNAKTTYGETALIYAIKRGDSALETVNLLVSKGADVNVMITRGDRAGCTPLDCTIFEKCDKSIGVILKKRGAKLFRYLEDGSDSPKWERWTDLHPDTSDTYDNEKNANDSNENINDQDADGNTRLMKASREGMIDEVSDLLTKGAKVNAINREKETALMLACEYGHIDIVKILIKHGANVNAKTDCNGTALTYAITDSESALEIIKLLVFKGADVNAMITRGEQAGQTPLDCTVGEKCDKSIAVFLKKRGAKLFRHLEDGSDNPKWERWIKLHPQFEE